jgi:hypothetical protein
MKSTRSQPVRPALVIGLAALAGLGCAVGVVAGGTQPATANDATALALADKLLESPSLVADESPYNVIDAIGPGGITPEEAVVEVTSRTMLGGLPAPTGTTPGY